ncbi:transposase [Aestuariicoccus sp. KMU-90]|uniref:Transposase n=1 Tax=Thetidibacter halocola TaxID=2827239 RepID=A0A8J7WK07_9RHOB|nr:transposase [Thetidibacter halocola]
MAGKREKPEDIITTPQQVEVLQGQGAKIADAVRQIGVTQQTCYRWRREYGGMTRDQLKRLKELEQETTRLRRAVANLTLDTLILSEAAKGNDRALRVAAAASSISGRSWAFPSAAPVGPWGSIDPRSARFLQVVMTRNA